MTTFKNETSYETLVEAGLPRLPENYFYKFFVKQTGERRGYLHCRIYFLMWGLIPLKQTGWHRWLDEMDDPSQAVYDIEDFVVLGKKAFGSVTFPKPTKPLPSQSAVQRFLNRRLP